MCLAPPSRPMPGNPSQWTDPPGPIPCFIMALTLAGFCLTLLLALSILILENSLGLILPPCPCLLECSVRCCPGTEKPHSSHTVLCFAVPLHRLPNELTERLDHGPRTSAMRPHLGLCAYLSYHSNSQGDGEGTLAV